MAFVTFVIAMAAIAAFYLYSTKPECRKAVNNWSTSACDILKEKIISSQDIIKQKEKRGTEAQQSGSPKGRLLSRTSDTDDKTAIVAEGETQAGIARRLSKTIQSQEEGQTSLSIRASTIGGMPEREVTKDDKKKKKKSKSKKSSKKKKGSKRSRKEGKKSDES